MDAIQTRNLSKRYGDALAVDNLNLSVHRGELFSLLGVNGAGKTTAIRMLCGLTRPTEGDALLNGRSILRDAAGVKKIIAVSPQETAIAPGLSVYENLELMCGVYGLSRSEKRRRIARISEMLGLEQVSGKRAGRLSGGWQRRLSIAMALIGDPEILFLDEPTLGLDVLARSELWALIRKLRGRMTILLTTHYMEEAEALSDRVGIMKDGRLLLCDTPARIKEMTGAQRFDEAFVRIVQGVSL